MSMTQMRIYLPLNAAGVRRLAEARAVEGPVLHAFGVTERIERSLPAGDEEEWEYAALTEAFDAAGAALASRREKRVVAAADVDPSTVSGRGSAESPAAVEVTSPVPLSRVVSFHVDETAGDEGMSDLLWYDATELDEVLRLL